MCSGGDYDCCPSAVMLRLCCVCSGGDYDCCPLAVMLKVCCVCVQVVIMIAVHWL